MAFLIFHNRLNRRFLTKTAVVALTLLAPSSLPTMASQSAANEETPTAANETPKVGGKAADFELETLGGGKTQLSTLLKKGPVVLVVLRGYPGYQCPICTNQVGSLLGKAKQFRESKAQVLLVYPGPAEGLQQHADEFVKGKDIPANFQIVLDPDYVFTNKYGLRWRAPGETSYPSTFVIDSKSKVLFAKTSRSHGNRARTEEILKALQTSAQN